MPNAYPKTLFEAIYWQQGCQVAGVDEVGRGPLAGPVVAAAVVLDPRHLIEGIDDSKVLSPNKRNLLYELILENALAVGVGAVGPRTIERINILEASREAMRRALSYLRVTPDVVLSDAMSLASRRFHTVSLIHGDARSLSVGAASIVAKVVRDRYMQELHVQFPAYGFDQHKGYPTRQHREALQLYGACRAHRASFLHGVADDDIPV